MKTKRKKAAFCFSGQVRTLDLCYPYIKKNILDPLGKNGKDYDIFCCIIDDKDSSKVNLLKPVKVLKVKHRDFNLEYKDILNLNHRKFFTNSPLCSYLDQLDKLYLANQLRKEYQDKNRISYDWVFRIRFDFLPIKKIDYSKLNNKFLYLPKTMRGGDAHNDMFAIGSEKNLDLYSNQIKEFRRVIKTFFQRSPPIRLRVSFFLERTYISILDFLIDKTKPQGIFSKFYKKMKIISGNFFLRPPKKYNYNSEYALFKHLELQKVKVKILDLDYAMIRKNWSSSGILLHNQKPFI